MSYTELTIGPNRDFFDAEDITVSGTYEESFDAAINTHRVELWRNRFLKDDFVGDEFITRDGFDSTTWTNVGGGTYRLHYEKANDGVRVTSDNLTIHD